MSRLALSLLRVPNYIKAFGLFAGLRTAWTIEAGRLLRPGEPACVRLPGEVTSFCLRLTPADIGSFWQVLVKHEYSLDGFAQVERLQETYDGLLAEGREPVILDVGANIGAATLWFCHRFPKARLIAVEPDAANFALLEENTRHLPQVMCLHAAVAEAPGRVCITNPDAGAAGFQTSEVSTNGGDIEAVTMTGLLEMAGGDSAFIAKIDIEGAETRVFDSDCTWLPRTTVLMIEIHDWKFPGQASSRPVLHQLAKGQFDVLLRGENLIAVSTKAKRDQLSLP